MTDVMEDIRAAGFRTAVATLFTLAVIGSHVVALGNRARAIASGILPPRASRDTLCSVCGRRMLPARGSSRNLRWWRCPGGDSFLGIPVEEA